MCKRKKSRDKKNFKVIINKKKGCETLKKILHISNYLYPHIGGIEQVARDCMNSLKEIECEQKVICFNSNKKTIVDEVDGIEVIRPGTFLKVSSQSISLSYGKYLKEMMKKFQPDIVIFHYPNPFVAHYLCKYLKKKRFQFVLWWHLDITKQKILGKLFKKQNTKLLNFADKIVATSPNYIEGSPWLSSHKDKCVIIPCCINEKRLSYDEKNLSRAQEIKKNYNGKTICFAFGRHVEYKGLTYLIQASKLLDDSFAILIGGQGPLTEQLKKEASDDSKIHFLGRLSDEDLKAYLLACDIFCFPSITKNEAFGIGLAEAMYYGKPAITFTIPGSGVNYVNLNGITGIEVENRNVQAYNKAIDKLGNDIKLSKTFGENAKKHIIQNFVYDLFKKNVLELLSNLEKSI